jgi:putative transcriptional regulator
MADGTLLVHPKMAPLRIRTRTLREAKGWTQGELAERAGVTRATVNRLEKGRPKSIDLDVLEKLAAALEVAPGFLIGPEEPAETPKHKRRSAG